ncbi:hypothetical protein SAMN05421740_1193 [Parapedobacter koreensis]|uniref:Uncharacterized protein n=1 Tax=Parapedobacter koreensis TaxID=332977 RepID=A0A1H7UN71_9SPHI|nr:hypothetical protein SAMN05421740_1193 [Parapedobacter koreensis]
MLYNSLFIHSYILALRSKSNQDMPLFIPVMLIGLCLALNLMSILFFVEGVTTQRLEIFNNKNEYVVGVLIYCSVFLYYLHKKRYKRIFETYKAKHSEPPAIWWSIMVVALYYLVSVFIVFLSGFYRNKDWIFSGL